MSNLTAPFAPFPWYGGKRRHAPRVWELLGDDIGTYVEPFAGSLAVLLYREEPVQREVVCDLDGGLCNFWRAVSADPDAVAHWADWPTIHQDLTARHRWLVEWVERDAARLEADPTYYDAQAAGWWVWGISLWIGGGWCQRRTRPVGDGKMPHLVPSGGGSGVSAQRRTRPVGDGQMPHLAPRPGGSGVSAQRRTRPVGDGKRPYVNDRSGGQGVSAQRRTRPDLLAWFAALQQRLQSVVVLNRSWESALTPTVLGQTTTSPQRPVGVFVDPPYLQDGRHSEVYGSDLVQESSSTAQAAWAWAVEHGERYRIIYCAHAGDFSLPPGWRQETMTFQGVRDAARRAERQDCMLISPACVEPQPSLLDAIA